MNQLRLQIDHVGLLGPAISDLVEEFGRLGFVTVGPTELQAVDETGARTGLGQFSAHVMFDQNYIELTAVEKPTPAHHLAHFLHPPWGMRLLLPACDDIQAAHAACCDNGLNPYPVQTATRSLSYAEDATARFHWFSLPSAEWPDTMLAYVEHLTPELVFDERVSRHPNDARGIARLYYIGEELPQKFEYLDSDGAQHIEAVPPALARETLGFDSPRTTPFAGIGIAVGDVEETASLLRDAGATLCRCDKGYSVQLECGVCLIFEQAADD